MQTVKEKNNVTPYNTRGHKLCSFPLGKKAQFVTVVSMKLGSERVTTQKTILNKTFAQQAIPNRVVKKHTPTGELVFRYSGNSISI